MSRFSQRQIEQARAKYALSALIGRDVKLVKRGRDHVGLCPFHKERTPSFTVVDDKRFYHCFGCGAHGDAIAWRMQQKGETFAEAMQFLLGERPEDDAPARYEAPAAPARRELSESDLERRGRAATLLDQAAPIGEDLARHYLRLRGLKLPPPPSLLFHPAVWHPFAERVFPALLARVTSPDGAHRGAWRIYLDPATGGKARVENPKLGLGAQEGGAVHLSPAPLQATRLDVAEGIETSLGVLQRHPHLVVWAALSTSGLRKLEIPGWVEELVIWADLDPPDARRELAGANGARRANPMFGKRPGTLAAEDLAARARSLGRRVAIVHPGAGDGSDFRDVFAEA